MDIRYTYSTRTSLSEFPTGKISSLMKIVERIRNRLEAPRIYHDKILALISCLLNVNQANKGPLIQSSAYILTEGLVTKAR